VHDLIRKPGRSKKGSEFLDPLSAVTRFLFQLPSGGQIWIFTALQFARTELDEPMRDCHAPVSDEDERAILFLRDHGHRARMTHHISESSRRDRARYRRTLGVLEPLNPNDGTGGASGRSVNGTSRGATAAGASGG